MTAPETIQSRAWSSRWGPREEVDGGHDAAFHCLLDGGIEGRRAIGAEAPEDGF